MTGSRKERRMSQDHSVAQEAGMNENWPEILNWYDESAEKRC